MMDWTDRHCRRFHRAFSRRVRLYTEMVVAEALVHGSPEQLLRHDPAEHPVALQLGGSDPDTLARAARIGVDAGFDEINLNVGCPSDRVQAACFGAALMRDPALVAECILAMRDFACAVPVTVKCRIGVDDQEPASVLPDFLGRLSEAGVTQVIIHARKAWLQGLSPKENREIPPLDYGLVHRMKARFPELAISLNGGISSLREAEDHLRNGLDGVMIGRAAYHDPALLGSADREIFGVNAATVTPETAIEAMLPYIQAERAAGTPLHAITRHMLGAFRARPGARAWRRTLSQEALRPGAGVEVVQAALRLVAPVEKAAPEQCVSVPA